MERSSCKWWTELAVRAVDLCEGTSIGVVPFSVQFSSRGATKHLSVYSTFKWRPVPCRRRGPEHLAQAALSMQMHKFCGLPGVTCGCHQGFHPWVLSPGSWVLESQLHLTAAAVFPLVTGCCIPVESSLRLWSLNLVSTIFQM